MIDAPRPRDEWRWLIWLRLGSIDAIEKVYGVGAFSDLAREKRALASLDVFINEYEAKLIAERNSRNRR
jgi:hypothetical protein